MLRGPTLPQPSISATIFSHPTASPSSYEMQSAARSRSGSALPKMVAAVHFQDWMRIKNEHYGSDIYVGMNALKTNAFTRTKHDVLAIRLLYADFDVVGSASPGLIEKSNLVPP